MAIKIIKPSSYKTKSIKLCKFNFTQTISCTKKQAEIIRDTQFPNECAFYFNKQLNIIESDCLANKVNHQATNPNCRVVRPCSKNNHQMWIHIIKSIHPGDEFFFNYEGETFKKRIADVKRKLTITKKKLLKSPPRNKRGRFTSFRPYMDKVIQQAGFEPSK